MREILLDLLCRVARSFRRVNSIHVSTNKMLYLYLDMWGGGELQDEARYRRYYDTGGHILVGVLQYLRNSGIMTWRLNSYQRLSYMRDLDGSLSVIRVYSPKAKVEAIEHLNAIAWKLRIHRHQVFS